MALSLIDVFNNYSNNKSGFIRAMNNDPNAGAMWDNFKSISTKTTASSVAEKVGSYAGEAVKTLTGTQNIPQGATSLSELELFQPGDFGKYVSNIINAVAKEGSIMDKIIGTFDAAVFSPISTAIKEVTFFTEKEIELRYKINSQLGMAGKMTLDFRNNIEEASVKMVDVGYGFDDVADTLISITKNTGTMAMLGAEVMERNRFTIKAAIGDLSQVPGFIQNFSDIGIGAESSFKQIEKSFKGSMELGLIGRKVVSDVNNNLSKINQYGFKNGVDGLTRMVQKSIEFKINMEETFKIAATVMNPEGAIDMAANLMAIGGAIGDLGDPLKMMYNATNNVEGIQDALIGAASSLTTFNKEGGKFEVIGINLRKAKAMADAMGVSMEELTKSSIKSAERQSATISLMSRGLSLDDKEKEFITNISRMEDGKMVIDVSSISKEFEGAQQIALDSLTDSQVKILKKYQSQFKEMDIKDIAREQFTTTQNIALNVSALVAMGRLSLGKQTGKLGSTLVEIFGKDLESSIRAQRDKIMGKSTDAEVKRAFGDNNPPTSTNVRPVTTSQEPVDISKNQSYLDKQRQLNSNYENQNKTTKVEMTIINNVNKDKMATELENSPVFVKNIMDTLSKGEYTNVG